MPPHGIPSSFYRGGTSRGLIFRASTLAPFSPSARSHIIRTALGSPDPMARQIDGLGGGVSSLSKAMIVSVPGEGWEEQGRQGRLPGVEWADEGHRKELGEWDVVYRFCQVGVRDEVLDWSATCGNMLSAVALHSITSTILPTATLHGRARALPSPPAGQPLLLPLSILSASNGAVMRARVPLDPDTLEVWEPREGDGTSVRIAGVPGKALGIEVEMPLPEPEESAEEVSVGGTLKTVLEGHEIAYSLSSSGLPNILLPISSLSPLSIPSTLLTAPNSTLTSHPTLAPLLETLRQQIAHAHSLPFSLSSPKIILVGPVLTSGYETSSGTRVSPDEADFIARAVSSGDFHATIPGTTLGAINVSAGVEGSVVSELMAGRGKEQEGMVTVRVGHAAGVASSSVRFEPTSKGAKGRGRPVSVVMMRTAREIMRGEVLVDLKE